MSGLLRRLRPSNGRTADPAAPAEGAVPATAELEQEAAAADALADTPADGSQDAATADPAPDAAAVAAPPGAETVETVETVETPAAPADAPTQVVPPSGGLWATPAPAEATQVMPAMTSGDLPGEAPKPEPLAAAEADELVEERPLPAGVAPEDLIGDRPDTRRRSRLRRRVRHLRRVRELMLRDIGGLVYEIHRAGQDPAAEGHRHALVGGKLDRLVQLDAERLELEASLGLIRGTTVLREPGVGGACPVCSEYFASDATFCFRCGTRVDGRAPAPVEAPVVAAAPPALEDPTPEETAVPPPVEAEATGAEVAPAETEPVAAEAQPAEAEPVPAETEPLAAEVQPAEAEPVAADAHPAEAEATPAEAPEGEPPTRSEATT